MAQRRCSTIGISYLGRFAAAAAGATAGAAAGSALDGIVFDKYECRDCETTFD